MGREVIEKPDMRIRARRHGVSALVVLAMAMVAIWFLTPRRAEAAATRASTIVPDGSRYYRRATTGTTGTALAFPGGTATTSAWIHNEDGSNILYVKFFRSSETVASAELTAPADSTWSEVQPIPAGDTMVFDVRQSPGMIWDRAAGSGAFEIRLID